MNDFWKQEKAFLTTILNVLMCKVSHKAICVGATSRKFPGFYILSESRNSLYSLGVSQWVQHMKQCVCNIKGCV